MNFLSRVEKDTGIRWLSGAIYGPLNRIFKNEYIVARSSKEPGEYGGRPRIYYKLTPRGKEKLASIQTVTRALWAGVPCLKNEFEGSGDRNSPAFPPAYRNHPAAVHGFSPGRTENGRELYQDGVP
jgi:DNA-binding PadR family transcriptional regulator